MTIKKIHWKLTLSSLLLVSVVIVIIGFILHNSLHSRLIQYAEEHMKSDVVAARDYLLTRDTDNLPEELDSLAENLGKLLNVRVTIIRDDGTVFGDSMVERERIRELPNHGHRPEVREALAVGFGKSIRRSTTVHRELLYMALPFELEGKGRWVVRLALPLVNLEHATEELKSFLFQTGLWGFFLALAFGYASSIIISRRALKIKEAADSFAQGDLRKKIPPMGNDELGMLAKNLNDMADALNQSLSKIASEKAELQAVLTSMVEGVLILDKQLRVVSINPALSQILEPSFPPEGLTLLETFRSPELNETAEKSLGKLEKLELEVVPTPHLGRTCMVHFSPIIRNGNAIGIVVVFNDITELKNLLNMRKEFVANVSHELRTPLTAIRGFAETLLQGSLEEKETAIKYLEGICRHTKRLEDLINDILHLSRVESRRIEIKREDLSLHDLVNGAMVMVQEAAAKKGVVLLNEVKADAPKIEADKKQLEQVFLNFLDNAIKYSNNGEGVVKISARRPDPRELEDVGFAAHHSRSFLLVSFADNGPGIPKKDLPRIFERFYRVDKARSRDLGGTGLGLSIIKHTIEGHGGKVWVESELGKGTSFYFLIPLK